MSNPVSIDLPEGNIELVATNILSGFFYKSIIGVGANLYYSYKVTGDPAPTPEQFAAVKISMRSPILELTFKEGVDVYFSSEGADSKIIVAV